MTDPAHPIRIRKIGHVGLYCATSRKMVDFYTRVLGSRFSDVQRKRDDLPRSEATTTASCSQDGRRGPEKGAGATILQQIAMEVASLDTLKRSENPPRSGP